jgi:plasmid replication initiation protein
MLSKVVLSNPTTLMDEEKRDKALQAIAKDPNRFIKTNPIINAKFDVTAVQMKVFLKVVASIDQSESDTPLIRISVKEFQNFIGGKAKNLYKYLGAELEKLGDKKIRYEDERTKLDANFFSSIEYFKKEGLFEFEFSQKIKPFLLQIKENFTVLDIRNLLYLDSIYAIRFYEFCKEYERFKGFEFYVDELKDRFEITNRYKNYFDFKLKVLQQARAELMRNSELYFDFEEIKLGKKVVKLKFTIVKNNNKLPKHDDNENQESQRQINEIYDLVKDFVSEETVISWFKKYLFEQIKSGVRYTLNEHKQGKVKDMPRYLQKMVSTSNLFNTEVAPLKEQTINKLQNQPQDNSQIQNSLKEEYLKRKLQLALQLIQDNSELHNELMQELRLEYRNEKRSISVELALDNFKSNSNSSSADEFIDNFLIGGMFQAYMLEKLTIKFGSFKDLKNEFIPKAKQIGLKENDLF